MAPTWLPELSRRLQDDPGILQDASQTTLGPPQAHQSRLALSGLQHLGLGEHAFLAGAWVGPLARLPMAKAGARYEQR